MVGRGALHRPAAMGSSSVVDLDVGLQVAWYLDGLAPGGAVRDLLVLQEELVGIAVGMAPDLGSAVRPHSACGGFPPAPEAIKPSP